MGSTGLGEGPVASFCAHGDETSDCTKGCLFLDELCICQLCSMHVIGSITVISTQFLVLSSLLFRRPMPLKRHLPAHTLIATLKHSPRHSDTFLFSLKRPKVENWKENGVLILRFEFDFLSSFLRSLVFSFSTKDTVSAAV